MQNTQTRPISFLWMLCCGIAGFSLGVFASITGFNLFNFSLFFVIPVGHLIAGFVAALIFYTRSVAIHRRPEGDLLLNIILGTLVAELAVHSLIFIAEGGDGLGTFLSTIDPGQMTIRWRGGSPIPTGPFWGWLITLINLSGFAMIGIATFQLLNSQPYCDRCNKYLDEISNHVRFSKDKHGIEDCMATFRQLVEQKKYADAIRFHDSCMGDEKEGDNTIRTTITLRKCSGCSIRHLTFELAELVKKANNSDNRKSSWLDVDSEKVKAWINVDYDSSISASESKRG